MARRASLGVWIVLSAFAIGLAGCGGGADGTGGAGGAGGSGGNNAGGSGTGTAMLIDECALGTHACDANADCIDTPAFYECACKAGFAGDGKSCADIDECQKLIFDCDSNALCTNTVGSYSCACPPGFVGDGKTCDATYSDISAGQYHACAVRSDKTVQCWGLNTSGQVGTGTSDVLYLKPAPAGDASDWAGISVGGAFSCARNESKRIFCWGTNSLGQLADGTLTAKLSPTPIVGGYSDWVSMDAGATHACAIRENGEMYCWGSNNRGQVGDGTTNNQSAPTLVSGAGPWLSVSSGSEFSCAIRDDHTLWCWGLNSSRQLGNGLTTNSSVPVQEKSMAADWAQVTAGNAFACAVKMDGTRSCWGTNSLGQGGDGTTASIVEPKLIGMENDWASLDAGDFAVCGLRTTGALSCFGDGSMGQTGTLGDESPKLSVVIAGSDTDWLKVSMGLRFGCGLRAGGTLYCWGSASRGATGFGYTSDRNDPSPVGAEKDWAFLDVQMDNGCAIRKNGDLYCWGRNAYGNLGDGTSITRALPVQIGAGKIWKAVRLGRTHICGIADEGAGTDMPFCWGWDANGELGNGTGTSNQNTPVMVNATPGNTSGWMKLDAGYSYNCGVRADNSLWCWGRNALGQLGDGTTTARSEPAQVMPLGALDWADVAASGEFTCGLKSTGAVFCWGRNDVAQLGLGNTNSPVNTPTEVLGISNVMAVDVGANHACAVQSNGTLWCWGRNASAELGLGNTVGPALSPVQVGTDADWARPVLGQGTSTCAIKKNGDLYCWGTGSYGQLGMGGLVSPNKPAKVPSVVTWTAASMGLEHACGLQSDGIVSCWGASNWAQLGSGVPFAGAPSRVVDP